MSVAVAATYRTLAQVERNVRERAELVDVIVHAPLLRPTQRGYRRWLCDLYGFVAPVEAKLSVAPGLERSFRLPLTKARSIADDLLDVGMTCSEHALLRRPCEIPDFVDPVQALGWLMILERVTWKLGTIRDRLTRVASLSSMLDAAGSFVRTHECLVRDRWLELGRVVDRHVFGHEGVTYMTECAYDGLDCLDRWMVK
jgi:heme oxygenase